MNHAEERANRLSAAPTAVSVDSVSKSFRLPHQRYSTLKERALHPFAVRTDDVLHALRDVTSRCAPGSSSASSDATGVARARCSSASRASTRSTRATIAVDGRLSPFIELGVGFNPDLTARDNVIINAIMLGLTPTRGARPLRRDHRVRRARGLRRPEAEELLVRDERAARLLGRRSRSTPTSLLVDEVLAVGDASFQQKCFDRVRPHEGATGRTILFVTHDMGSVERFCDRGLVLERGELVDSGRPSEITRTYGELNFGHPAGATRGDGARRRRAIAAAWCEDRDGERIVTSGRATTWRACFEVQFERAPSRTRCFSLIFRNDVRHTIFGATSRSTGASSGRSRRGARDRPLRASPTGWRPAATRSRPRSAARRRPAHRPTRGQTTWPRSRARRRYDGRRGRRALRVRGGAQVNTGRRHATRYRGPSAVGEDLRRFWSLTFTLAATDFKLRFFGSALGYLWSLVRPLLLFGMLYFVFTRDHQVRRGRRALPGLPPSSLVLFTFFSETTSRGVTSLVDRENLLRKIRFPRMVIPLVGRAPRAVQPRAEPRRGVRLHLRVRHRPRARLAPDPAARSRCSWSSPPA